MTALWEARISSGVQVNDANWNFMGAGFDDDEGGDDGDDGDDDGDDGDEVDGVAASGLTLIIRDTRSSIALTSVPTVPFFGLGMRFKGPRILACLRI